MAKSIFLEGVDGTGKSTLTEKLKQLLESKGEKVLSLREPGGTPYYEAIREHIHFESLDRSALSDALTCAGGIAENIRQTRKALEKGIWVISDRSYISNAVYQIAQGLDEKVAEQINQIALQGFKYDVKILLDMPLEKARERLAASNKKTDRWEAMGKAYFESIQTLYQELARRDDLTVLDATQSIDDLVSQITDVTGL